MNIKCALFVALLALAVMTASPAQANGSIFAGGNITVGMRETVRNAGVDGNFNIEVYYTPDGRVPNAEDRQRGPAYTLEGNYLEPGVINRTPGDPVGRWWAVINWKPLNAGEIKTIQTELEAVELPYSAELGGYLVDLSAMPAGKYFVGLSVSHLGGENVTQVLIFVFRSRRQVTDQAGFWLTVFDPERPYYEAEVAASPFMRGFEPLNGAKVFESATGEQAPLRLIPVSRETGLPAPDGTVSSGSGRVRLSLYQDQHLLQPGARGEFKLVAVDGSYQTPMVPVDGNYTFHVPPGRYYVWGDQKAWQLPPGAAAQFDVDTQVIHEVILERK